MNSERCWLWKLVSIQCPGEHDKHDRFIGIYDSIFWKLGWEMRRMMKWLYMIAQMVIQTPLRSRDLDHVGDSPLCSSRLPGKRLGTGPEILQEEEYHLPETNTVFYGHMWSLLNRLSKNGNEANCVEKGHSANLLVYRITLIYQGFWPAIHTQQSKNILGLITGQFKISSLISSEGLQKNKQCVQTRDPFVTFFWCFNESRSDGAWGLHWCSESSTLGSLAKHRI